MLNGALRLAGEGWTLVTGGSRLARRLHYLYARERLGSGRQSWESADILPWDAWLQRSFHELTEGESPPRRLPGDIHSRYLWQQVIRSSPDRFRLLQPAAVAAEAARAAWLLQQWLLPGLPADSVLNEDAQAFVRWQRDFRARCLDLGLVDPAALEAEIMLRLQRRGAGGLRLAFLGFDAFTPRQRALLEALREAGAEVAELNPVARPVQAGVAGYQDRRAEMRAAALWARAILEEDATRSIGIVVPDLAARHRQVADIFEDVLVPGALLGPPQWEQRAFNVDFGPPLAEAPLVSAALGVLALASGPVPLADACRTLRSVYLAAGAQEVAALSRAEARLRRFGDPFVDLGRVRHVLEAMGDAALQPVAARLAGIRQLLSGLPERQRAGAWAADFSRITVLSGWPGQRALDSAEYQCAQAWQRALGEFAGLDSCGADLTCRGALRELRATLAEISFQPRSGEAAVEIVGAAGAAALGFDRVWVLGLDEESWPPPARPNPFIPLRLQRQLGMPRASPELALAEARQSTAALAAAAEQVVFSYPANEGETPLRPSPLLRAFPPRPDPASAGIDFTRQVFEARRDETVEDGRAPPPGSEWRGTGGAGLFRDQSACPFRAFARHRLQARAPEPVDIGLSGADRGNLVHRALQQIWEHIGDQRRLAQMDGAALQAEIGSAVDEALAGLAKRRPATVTRRFAAAERIRLAALLADWLKLERVRAPFRVEACEHQASLQIGGLPVTLRIDRIDTLDDGRAVILDYKTGQAAPGSWFGDRPDDPQLPLYAISAQRPLAALAFARIKAGEQAFLGLSTDEAILPGLRPPAGQRLPAGTEWEALLHSWRAVLERLAEAFLRGAAEVDPRDRQVCRRCDLHALCRINESRLDLDDDAD